MKKLNLAFIDMEMTGLNPTEHEILELAAIITSPNLKVLDEFEVKVKPEHIETADQTSLKISNYSAKEWGSAVSLREAMETLNAKAKDCVMIAHNVAFDSLFIEAAFAKLGIANALHYHKLDTVSVAWAKLHREPDLEHFSLRELCLRFGIENPKAHTALSDARATYALYKKLMEL
ncbi:MAG: 3'-5' exonuclease [Patescibacteria group bacterium]